MQRKYLLSQNFFHLSNVGNGLKAVGGRSQSSLGAGLPLRSCSSQGARGEKIKTLIFSNGGWILKERDCPWKWCIFQQVRLLEFQMSNFGPSCDLRNLNCNERRESVRWRMSRGRKGCSSRPLYLFLMLSVCHYSHRSLSDLTHWNPVKALCQQPGQTPGKQKGESGGVGVVSWLERDEQKHSSCSWPYFFFIIFISFGVFTAVCYSNQH